MTRSRSTVQECERRLCGEISLVYFLIESKCSGRVDLSTLAWFCDNLKFISLVMAKILDLRFTN